MHINTVSTVAEYVEWLWKAQRGDACKYYEYSITDRCEWTLSHVRDHVENSEEKTDNAIRLVALADRILDDSNAVYERLRFKGGGLVALVTRLNDGRRELLAIKL